MRVSEGRRFSPIVMHTICVLQIVCVRSKSGLPNGNFESPEFAYSIVYKTEIVLQIQRYVMVEHRYINVTRKYKGVSKG